MKALQTCAIFYILSLSVNYNSASKVIDVFNANKTVAEKYCPKSVTGCEEGSHVMCMYYRPDSKYGSMCHYPEDISITKEYADLLLEIVNGVRSRTARGKVKNKNGVLLPKGYTIYKLLWDTELATFAQVWADQCIIRRDRCHATETFPDPGQAVGVYHFTYEDWLPINDKKQFTGTGLTNEKVRHALVQIIQAIYTNSRSVLTPDMVKNVSGKDMALHSYLPLLFGSITHMGCGISAFRDYGYNEDGSTLLFNNVLLICNFSKRLEGNRTLYPIARPKIDGWTRRCGCPSDYDEDSSCLCIRSNVTVCDDCGGQELVVLPIFTVEDAAPTTTSTVNRVKDKKKNVRKHFNVQMPNGYILDQQKDIDIYGKHIRKNERIQIAVPQKYSFGIQNENNQFESFSKSKIIKDVRPRKDFSNIQEIVDAYYDYKRRGNLFSQRYNSTSSKRTNINVKNENLKANSQDKTHDPLQTKDNIITLLKKLENDTQNIELESNDRQVIKEKLLKIYNVLQTNVDSDKKHQRHNNENVCFHGGNDDCKLSGRNKQDITHFSEDNVNFNVQSNNNDNYQTTNLKETTDIRRTTDIRKESDIDDKYIRDDPKHDVDNRDEKSKILNVLDDIEEELRKKGRGYHESDPNDTNDIDKKSLERLLYYNSANEYYLHRQQLSLGTDRNRSQT